MELLKRPRRVRSAPAVRSLVQETRLHPADFITPFFLLSGHEREEPFAEMPGVSRLSIDLIVEQAKALHAKGVPAIILFPTVEPELKDPEGREAYNPNGCLPQAIRILKKEIPTLLVMADIALDLYSSHGHDGILVDDEIDNDLSIEALKKQALVHAQAGVDFIAPSDMMDGRIKAIREHLDHSGFTNVGILSYAAKFSSAWYSTYRRAHSSAPRKGDKLSYQLSTANIRQALIEAQLDEEEGADLLLVKPGMTYLDVVAKIKANTHLPVGVFFISGEYAMIMAADKLGYVDGEQAVEETLLSMKRAGADFIVTYCYKFILSL